MGTGASSQPAVGVAQNPRVEYASKIAQSEGKVHLIDAPVLVNLPDGTVRYRYVDRIQGVNDSTLSVHEGPHRGQKELEYKKGYFFHARLADYGKDAKESNAEAEHKFKYVYKGPMAAKNKRLYYVTGKGVHAADSLRSYSSGLNTPTWPNIRRQPNHVYYNLELRMDDSVSMDDSIDTTEEINSDAPITLTVNGRDSIESLKEQVSMHTLKPTAHLHVFNMQREIRSDTDMASLVTDSHGASKDRFKVRLVKLAN